MPANNAVITVRELRKRLARVVDQNAPVLVYDEETDSYAAVTGECKGQLYIDTPKLAGGSA